MAPELTGIEVAGDPAAWTAAGFAVHDNHFVLDGVTVTCSSEPGATGILGWSMAGVETGSIDGLRTTSSIEALAEALDVPHPNGTIRIDHVVVASSHLPRTVGALGDLGIEPRRTRDTELNGSAMRQVFFRLGQPILELIGPPEPADERPTAFWGLALTVADLDATKDLLGDALGDPKDAVQPGRRIASLHHEALGLTVPIAFMSE